MLLLSAGSGPVGAEHDDEDAGGGFTWALVFLLVLSLPAEVEFRGLRCLARGVMEPPPRLSQHSLNEWQSDPRTIQIGD